MCHAVIAFARSRNSPRLFSQCSAVDGSSLLGRGPGALHSHLSCRRLHFNCDEGFSVSVFQNRKIDLSFVEDANWSPLFVSLTGLPILSMKYSNVANFFRRILPLGRVGFPERWAISGRWLS